MAEAPESFYREVVRAGYRGAYLRSLAASVASGELDLEQLGHDRELPDDEVERRLLALPGVGPYAAAHVMMLIGRYTPLVLDSWTRPTYARINGRKASDRTIERRFRRYGHYAGLAFWLYLTRDWVEDSTRRGPRGPLLVRVASACLIVTVAVPTPVRVSALTASTYAVYVPREPLPYSCVTAARSSRRSASRRRSPSGRS